MIRVTATKARKEFSDLLNRAAYANDRIFIHRGGKDVAVLVSPADAALLEELEDKADIEAAREALREKGSLSLQEVRKALGL